MVALLLMGVVMFAWHTPRLYELALASSSWHEVEHACFFLTSLIFWWPVIRPWPSRAQWPRWAMIPYLLVGDLQNTALSAILTFSDRVIYPSYTSAPRLFRFSAQQDQSAAGAIMWVVGSLAFIVPAIVIAIQCLQRKSPSHGDKLTFRKRESSSINALLAIPQRFGFPSRILAPRFGTRTVEAVSFLVLFSVAGLCLARLASGSSPDDDDQALRFSQQNGPFSVAVFTPRGDLETGPVDFSVLVQDRNTQETLLDATVDLTAQPADGSRPEPAARATAEDSENKLLQSAELNLPAEGDWTIGLSVQRNAEHADFFLPVQVVKLESETAYRWTYLILLVFAGVLLFTYVWRHRASGASRQSRSAQNAAREGGVANLSSNPDPQ